MQHRFVTNTNGNTPESLLEEFRAVMHAGRTLRAALGDVTVHGRNYQTLADGADAHQGDLDAKVAAARALESIMEWAESGAMRALDQKEGRT